MSNLKSHCDECKEEECECDGCDMDIIMECCRCNKTCCSIHDWSHDCIGHEECNKHLCIECAEKYNERCWDCEHEK